MNDSKPQVLSDMALANPQPTCLTIGMFDGVHRGHRHLISQCIDCARRLEQRAALLTFHPHPIIVLREAEPNYLTSRQERLALLGQMGLDLIIVQPFTPGLAKTSGEAFVRLLQTHLNVSHLWVGSDFALGYQRSADIPFLRRAGADHGFDVHVVERLAFDGKPISSSRIRRALRQGNMHEVTGCLGRFYTLKGPVVVGAQRGRTLGFPTANVQISPGRAIPANGVYAAWATLCTENGPEGGYQAVANIGTRPTFDDGDRTVEAYLLDFDREIYGEELRLEFVARLRPEAYFESVEALVEQIWRDVNQAQKIPSPSPRPAPRC